jgi:hypothetical protein|tara:strand:+ start:6487 stop:6675 length:189 start_codon:yes stop_codon:yes gene_type:complete
MLKVLFHPVTTFNLLLVGCIGFIEIVHTKVHYTLESDVHGHVRKTLRQNPELVKSICRDLDE